MIDLHLHTRYSDGNWSPSELVERAIALGLKCIAVTDHDTVAGINEAIDAAAGRIRIIPGIEINTVWQRPDGSGKDVHILGYFIDQYCQAIAGVNERQCRARLEHVEQTIEKFTAAGMKVSMEDVLSAAGKGSIGRPHLSIALLNSGAVDTIESAYDLLMKRSSPFYVARQSITPFDAIDAIKKAGGLSSWAHPGKDKELETLLPLLQAHGLNGIEVYHRSHSHRLVRKFLKLARERRLLVTGGSDCHGPYKNYPASIGTIKVPPDIVSALERARDFVRSDGP
jgi:3',5'-nucleoside bisphosphate phosphatase